MGDVEKDPKVDDWLKKVLKNVSTKSGGGDGKKLKKAYQEIYTTLVKTLKDKTADLSGLMSQAVVPRLIRRMANIPKNQRSTIENLRNVLVGNPEDNISADYPYSRTQIMETYTRIQDDGVYQLKSIMQNPIRFGNPLMGAAALIADKMVPLEEDVLLGNSDRIQKFSMRVNLIQDVIVRHLIFGQVFAVPLVGDATLPATTEARRVAKADSKKRALGLGENPNPEMAAMLNPGLVMDPKDQREYLKELGMLAELISPEEASYNKSARDAFKNAGFAFSKEDLTKEVKRGKKGAADEIDRTGSVSKTTYEASSADREEELKEAQDFSKEMTRQATELQRELDAANEKLQQQDAAFRKQTNILKKLQAGKGAPPEPKLEKTVDYTRLAHAFLIAHLGVDQEIIELTEKWMKLYALEPTHVLFKKYLDIYTDTRDAAIKLGKATDDAQKDVIKAALTKRTNQVRTYGISSLMVGHEEIGVRRLKFYNPKKNVVLTHTKMIKIWAKEASINKNDRPNEADLLILTAHLGPAGQKLIKKMNAALTEIISSSIPESSNTLFFSNNTEPTERRRRRRQKNRTDEQVLMW